MGRPPKQGQTKLLRLNVPQQLWNYLSVLAERTLMGDTAPEVALYLLKERLLVH